MAFKKIAAKPAKTIKKTPAGAAASPRKAVGKKTTAPSLAAKPAPIVTRKYLAAEIAETHEMPKKQAETIVDDVFGLLISHLKARDRFRLGGLGVLDARRGGRNPATGAVIQIAASRKIVFRAAKELKESI